MNVELENAVERLGRAERLNRPAQPWSSEAQALLDERNTLRDACRAYIEDHDNDLADLAREYGMQPSPCDCSLCLQARTAIAETRNEET